MITLLNFSRFQHQMFTLSFHFARLTGVRFNIPATLSSLTWEMIQRSRGVIAWSEATAASHHISKVCTKRRSVEAIDDRVTACVQVAKDKQYVMYVFWCLLDYAWLEPVPDPQKIIGCPADHKGGNDYNGHLQGLHSRFGYYICSAASKAVLTIWKNTTQVES